jgi:hypothetical protein
MKIIAGLSSICISLLLIPWLEDLLKIYLIAMVVIITLTINLAFRIEAIWNWIIEKTMEEILKRMMQDEDVKKIVKLRYDAMMEKIRTKNEE